MPKSVKRPVLGEERASRQYVREYHVYMFVWKPLVSEWLVQCVKDPTSEMDKNTVAMVCTNFRCKEDVVDHVQQKSPSLYPCLCLCPIALWTTLQLGNMSTMEVNTDWNSQQNFVFIELKRPLNWLKNKITKIEENLNEIVKHRLFRRKCFKFVGFSFHESTVMRLQ